MWVVGEEEGELWEKWREEKLFKKEKEKEYINGIVGKKVGN